MQTDTPTARAQASWTALALLAAGQFIMVLDSSVMNVSITQIVADLDTTVAGVQLAITAYTLVMASLMLVGAKLGAIWGSNRTFVLGLAIYAAGSLTTALSPNLPTLLIGWSLIEGIGAVLVMPAIAALVVGNYEGRQRALAYGLLGGVMGAAIAAGPLIGGWVTTAASWRWVFVGEVVVVIGILLFRRRLTAPPRTTSPPQLDFVGAGLAAAGLGVAVFAILKASSWGWILPMNPPVIGGNEVAPLGFSPVPFMVAAGLGLLAIFAIWEERVARRDGDPLVDLAILRIPVMRAGLLTLILQQLVLLGTFFLLPVYFQIVLGLDAFETGVRLLPLSVTLFVAALAGPRMAAKRSPRSVVYIGLGVLVVSSVALAGAVDAALDRGLLSVALAGCGLGAGLLLSQLGNVIMSSVSAEQSNEAGGLQGTAQNLGASLGTALVGAVLLTGLATGFQDRVASNAELPAEVQSAVLDATADGIDTIPVAEANDLLIDAGVDDDDAERIADDYGESQLEALKRSLMVVALVAMAGLWPARRLPSRPM